METLLRDAGVGERKGELRPQGSDVGPWERQRRAGMRKGGVPKGFCLEEYKGLPGASLRRTLFDTVRGMHRETPLRVTAHQDGNSRLDGEAGVLGVAGGVIHGSAWLLARTERGWGAWHG